MSVSRSRLATASILAVITLVLAACGGSSNEAADTDPSTTSSSTGPEPTTPDQTSPPTSEPTCIEQIPTERLIALVPFVMVVDGTDVSGMVDRVGGIGLVGPHRAGSVAAIRADLDAADLPPLLASDEEGGTVQRLRDVLGPLPSAERISAMPLAEARSAYDAYAAGLARVGIDLNFAPTLDVGAEAIGSRSYSDDPEVVAERAGLFVDAMAGADVLPVLKHFPGLGGVNTDHGVAETAPLPELEARDLVPYQRLLGGEAPVAVMTSHAQVPGLSDGLPASLSPATYEHLVEAYGFTGLVVTDSLGAGAVAAGWSTADAAVLAVAAGADMVVFTDPTMLDPVLDALGAATVDGRIPAARLHDAASAVLEAQGVDPCELVGATG